MNRTILSAILFATVSALQADTIRLKSGETIEGTIKRETADSVTIEVPFSATIMDSRIIPKAEIEAMVRQTKDERTFLTLDTLEVPNTALDASALRNIQSQFEAFIRDYPNSHLLADAKERLAAINAEAARIDAGEVKFNGAWIPAKEYSAEKYQIEASLLTAKIQSLAADGDPGEALNLFAELKKTYPQSIGYGEAVAVARKAATDLERRLAFEIGNLPIKLAERAKTVERSAASDQARVKQALEQQDARLKQAAEQAKSTDRKFFKISSIDEFGLKQMQKDVVSLQKELAKPEYSKLETTATAAKIEVKTILSADAEEARTALDSLTALWPQFEALPRLKAKVEAKEAEMKASQDPTPSASDSSGIPKPQPKNTASANSGDSSAAPAESKSLGL